MKRLILAAGLAVALTLSACHAPHPPPVPGPIQPPAPPGTSISQ